MSKVMRINTDDFRLLSPYIRTDTGAVSLEMLLEQYMPSAACRLLDFGCGEGALENMVRHAFPEACYTGVDIGDSPEIARRDETRSYDCYDGKMLPYGDQSFDVIYTNQVLEHVRHPDQSISELFRVLRPGGYVVGALSYLEPYHSFSIFNITPYGLYRLLSEHGFALHCLAAGPEGTAMAIRQLTHRKVKGFSPIYAVFRVCYWLSLLDAKSYQYLKLRYAGHVLFVAQRPLNTTT